MNHRPNGRESDFARELRRKAEQLREARLHAAASETGDTLADDLRTILPGVMLRNITEKEQSALKRLWALAEGDDHEHPHH